MNAIGRWWKSLPVVIRKPLVLVVGFAVVAAGIAMLVLPGPGWAAIFLGFAILATEFAFAEKARDQLVVWLKAILAWGQSLWYKIIRKKVAPEPSKMGTHPVDFKSSKKPVKSTTKPSQKRS